MYCPNSQHGRPEMAKAGTGTGGTGCAPATGCVGWAGWAGCGLAGLLSDSQLALLCYTTAAVLTDM